LMPAPPPWRRAGEGACQQRATVSIDSPREPSRPPRRSRRTADHRHGRATAAGDSSTSRTWRALSRRAR
jgi:hypothetical protein